MNCVHGDIISDDEYIRIYYPLDDTINNKGMLTLVTPVYAHNMSKLLTISNKGMVSENT